MRKPRDLDAELTALAERAKLLKVRRVQQLGELVIVTGADALNIEALVGALLTVGKADTATVEAWREAGAGFFQDPSGPAGRSADARRPPAPDAGGTPPADAPERKA